MPLRYFRCSSLSRFNTGLFDFLCQYHINWAFQSLFCELLFIVHCSLIVHSFIHSFIHCFIVSFIVCQFQFQLILSILISKMNRFQLLARLIPNEIPFNPSDASFNSFAQYHLVLKSSGSRHDPKTENQTETFAKSAKMFTSSARQNSR